MTFPPLPLISDHNDKSSQLKNRLRKNYQHRRKWAERTQTNCFRIYDRDIKEYPFAIDFYNQRFCLHYFASLQDSDDRFEKEVEDVLNKNTKQLGVLGRTPKTAAVLRVFKKIDPSKLYEDELFHPH